MSIEIITDGEKLGKYVAESTKMYATAGNRIHIALVSALWFAAKHGYVQYLNQVYQALRSNDKTAVKLYIRRAHAIVGLEGENPDGLDSAIILAAVEAGTVLKLTKDEFSVVAGHNTKQAQALAKLCEERFIDPDGEVDHKVLERNNFAEVKTLGDGEALAQLIKLAKSFEDSTDTRKVTVTNPVKEFLASIKDKAEAMAGQLSLSNG